MRPPSNSTMAAMRAACAGAGESVVGSGQWAGGSRRSGLGYSPNPEPGPGYSLMNSVPLPSVPTVHYPLPTAYCLLPTAHYLHCTFVGI